MDDTIPETPVNPDIPGTPITPTPPVRKKRKVRPWIRMAVQLLFFGIVAFSLLDISLHAVCPFGGVVTLYQLFTTGDFIQKIHASSLVLMTAVFLLAFLFGPVFCGWVCPFGTFQQWIAMLGRKLLGRRYNKIMPKLLDRILRYFRFVLLALVVYNTAATAKLMFQEIDPYYALFNFWTGEVAIAAYVILGATVLLSLFVERPWCRYACPYGALLGLTNKIRFLKLRRVEATCTHCGACDRACPVGIPVSKRDTVTDLACNGCMKCTSEEACPVKGTVVVEPFFVRRKK
jgi:polyferredoxin